ncbi:MAG: helix-turn-helix domain-containing protein [Candidatus Ventricola sp.]
MNELLERMDDLEKRVLALEERTRRFIWTKDERKARREEELFDRYGEYVDKTAAAQILGVTRATVYKMLDDGRIEGACGGKRVDVRSIARFINQRKGDAKA